MKNSIGGDSYEKVYKNFDSYMFYYLYSNHGLPAWLL